MKILAQILLLLSFLIVGVVFGHSGATGIVKQRMDAMEDMSDRTKLVKDMFKGKSEFNKHIIADAADAFSKHGKQMAELFPDTEESRTGSNTEALPKVWEDWDGFSRQVTQFTERSDSLKEIILETDDVGQLEKAFLNTVKSCSVCHKRYRKPKH